MSRRILVVEDDAVLNTVLCNALRRVGHETISTKRWSEAHAFLDKETVDLVLLDVNLPDADGLEILTTLSKNQPVMVLTAYGSVQNAVRAMKNGAAEYLVKPINLDELEMVVERVLRVAALRSDHSFIKSRLDAQKSSNMVGASPAIDEVRRLITAVAPSDMTVLIHGESGVGKELVAAAIHAQSQRAEANYVTVDCCILQRHLFESELFGHEKGSFTGADRQKKGLIEGAEHGTLFLDEIGEIEPVVQAKLLRVLETGHYRRLGGTRDLVANVRIIAATNRDLAAMSREGTFRADLYYRLAGFVIEVPPLRTRREDVPELARHFLSNNDFSRRFDKSIHPTAMSALKAYDWPGNIRELRNMMERAIILSGQSSIVGPEQFALASSPPTIAAAEELFSDEPTLDMIKQRYLMYLLKKYDGHRSTVAQKLGISERNTYRLLQRYQLES